MAGGLLRHRNVEPRHAKTVEQVLDVFRRIPLLEIAAAGPEEVRVYGEQLSDASGSRLAFSELPRNGREHRG
ncbi:MAG: hypothetical protein LC780_07795, partial [Acidobacteria bacterium]|nr:hypothetical protein [Acidobacteriota bacterium]